MEFLKTRRRKYAIENFIENLKNTVECETILIKEGEGRIASESYKSSIDIPYFSRSIVDGYICSSKMTSGASNNNPIPFDYGGEICIGEKYEGVVDANKVYYIPTGAAIPDGFDSVVMIEDTEKVNDTIYVEKTLFEGENIIYKGEDIRIGDKIIEKGKELRSVDIGILASQGFDTVSVYKKVKIAIIPTGKELKKPGEKLDNYLIYDINSYTLKSLFSHFKYFDVTILDIVKDDESFLKGLITDRYGEFDAFIISGGSSKGMRDITVKVIEQFGKPGILTHGIDISPGKPTILSLCEGKIIFGAPGHPVSSYISARFIMMPILNYFAGKENLFEKPVGEGQLSMDIPSKHGMDEFIRVKIGNSVLDPIFGQSGMISTLSKSDGLIIIENEKEGLYKGDSISYYSII